MAQGLPLLLLLATARAEAPASSELVEKLKQKKIARFFSRIEADATLPAELRKDVLKLQESGPLGGEFDSIHQALLLMNPDYQRADALLQSDRYGAAVERFEALMKSADEYVRGYSTFRYALAQMNRERYEEAGQAFTRVLNEFRFAGCDVDAACYLVVCLGQEREKEKAIAAANAFLKDYPDAPERYKQAMEQLKNELVQEWESPLYDLAGKPGGVWLFLDGLDEVSSEHRGRLCDQLTALVDGLRHVVICVLSRPIGFESPGPSFGQAQVYHTVRQDGIHANAAPYTWRPAVHGGHGIASQSPIVHAGSHQADAA